MFGLMAYPAQGVYKSVKAAKGRQAAVTKSKQLMLESQAALVGPQLDSTRVCSEFEAQSRAAK